MPDPTSELAIDRQFHAPKTLADAAEAVGETDRWACGIMEHVSA